MKWFELAIRTIVRTVVATLTRKVMR